MQEMRGQPSDSTELPPLTEDLLPFLDRHHPSRCMAPGETLEAHLRYAGARELIEELIEWWKDQTDIERKAAKDQGGAEP